jgi:hypothetical protein
LGVSVAAVAATAALAWLADVSGIGPLLGLLVVPAIWLLAPSSAGAGALSGPPVLAAIVAALALVARSRPGVARAFVPTVALLYAGAAWRVQHTVGPEGDEPHYLMVSDSLLRDHDLSLEDDYREGRYASFFSKGPLAPHYRVRGRHGEIYSLHAVGLSLLILPAYAVGGYPAASFFMAGLGVLVAIAVRALARAATDEATGHAVGWVVALSPPLLSYAGLVFTEVPAALAVAWVLREGMRDEDSLPRALAAGATLACLPWLNVRYAIVSGILAVYWLSRRRGMRAIAAMAAPALLSALALGAYHQWLYGFFDPRRVYGREREFSPAILGDGLPGLFLDQEFGLLVYAPVFVLAVPGLVALVRRARRLGLASVALVVALTFTAACWPMWRGGFNPPARFLVPLLPAFAVGVAEWIRGRRWAGAALLVGWGVFVGLAGALDPDLVHRDRDGTAPLFRARSGATEWTRLLPGYVLSEPDRHHLALLWVALLALAAVRGRASGGALARGVLVLAVAAQAASRLSDGRAGGREATHTLGRLAIEWPGAAAGRVTLARWGPADLGWGPIYEPHRHSGRVAVGERLRLPPGEYRLEIEAQDLGGPPQPPFLLVFGARGRPIGRAACAADRSCPVAVPAEASEVTLLLDGGSPFELKEIRLVQPLSTPGV